GGDVLQPLEADACTLEVVDEAVEHRDPRAAADELRVAGEVVDAAGDVLDHVVELLAPQLLDLPRRREAAVEPPDVLERREVVEAPARRHLDERHELAE